MKPTVKSDVEASGSEIEPKDSSDDKMMNFRMPMTYDSLYEESCKLIERVSQQKAKHTKLRNELEHVKNEKDS